MELKVEADTFTISGQNTPQELEQALSQLCELHAQVTGARDANGNPAFAAGRAPFSIHLGSGGTMDLWFLHPVFGAVVLELTATSVALLLQQAGKYLELALATAGALGERQRDGKSLQ